MQKERHSIQMQKIILENPKWAINYGMIILITSFIILLIVFRMIEFSIISERPIGFERNGNYFKSIDGLTEGEIKIIKSNQEIKLLEKKSAYCNCEAKIIRIDSILDNTRKVTIKIIENDNCSLKDNNLVKVKLITRETNFLSFLTSSVNKVINLGLKRTNKQL